MKLIVVDRTKLTTFQRLIAQFADALNVKVVLDRRLRQIRKSQQGHVPERRRTERRRLTKSWQGRDYIVIHVAGSDSHAPPP